MKFIPSQTLVNLAKRVFLTFGISCFITLLVLGVTYCTSSPECNMVTKSKAEVALAVIGSLTIISWGFMRVIDYRDFCAKVEAGIIKMPPQRPPREKIGHNSSLSEALSVLNQGEKLNGWYLVGYAIAFLLIEFIRLAGASVWLLIPAVVCFAVPEIHGIRIRKHTLSQTVWIFQSTGSRFRKIVGVGLALWISLVVYDTRSIIAKSMPLTLGGISRGRTYPDCQDHPLRRGVVHSPVGYPVAELILIASVALWVVIGTSATIAQAIHWRRLR